MPYATSRIANARAPSPFWDSPANASDSPTAGPAAPPIDDSATSIDELAFVLATDHWSTLEKVWLLEQWRYDTLLLEVAGGEGFVAEPNDSALLQQISKALLQLGSYQARY